MRRSAVAFLLATLVACGGDGSDEPKYILKLGAVIDLTGNNSQASFSDALLLAEEHVTSGLKLAGHKDVAFRIITQDSLNEPTAAVMLSVRLAQTDGVKALVLDSSQNSIAVTRTFYDGDPSNDLGVPVQCSGCTAGSINNPTATHMDPIEQAALRDEDDWLFQSLMSTKLIAKALVRVLLEKYPPNGDRNGDGTLKLGLYNSDEAFGNATTADIKAFAMALTGAPLVTELLKHPRDADPNSYNWADDLAKLNDTYNQETMVTDGAPDAILFASFAQYYTAYVRSYNAGGYTTPSMFVHTFRFQSTLDNLGATANGWEGVSHATIDNGPVGDAFASSFQSRFGYAVSYRDSMYYDNATILMLAVIKAGITLPDPTVVTGEQVRDALKTLSDPAGELVSGSPADIARAIDLIKAGSPINYQGASGPMDHDATGRVRSNLSHYRVDAQKFVDLAVYNCVASDDCARQ